MKTPIVYYGGKQRLAPQILSLIPPHATYVEPYFGGGAVFFAKPRPDVKNNGHYREVINDHNEALINLYRVMREHPRRLQRMVDKTLYSEGEFRRAGEILEADNKDTVIRAWAYYVRLCQSFLRPDGGWRRSRAVVNSAAVWTNRKKTLEAVHGRLENVFIACDDALRVIQKWDSPHTFFYIDPPYPNCDQGHYRGFTQADFEELIKVLKKVKGSFVLANYDNVAVPKSWERFDVPAYNSNRKPGEQYVTEVMWRKLSKARLDPRVKKVYKSGVLDCFPGKQAA